MDFDSLYKNTVDHLDLERREWLEQSMEEISLSKNIFETYFFKSAMVKRKVGIAVLDSLNFQIDESTRILLLLHTLKYVENKSTLVRNAYKVGDTSEKLSIIKALSLLHANQVDSDTLKEISLLAKQATNEDIFCALALNNTYASEYLNDDEFNNMVLKALHLDLNLKYLIGLDKRNNNSLQILAKELCTERKNANRDLPLSIALVYENQDNLTNN